MTEIIVFFRVDASSAIGVGHVMRCLTLSCELRKRGMKVIFICAEIEGNLIELVRSRGIEVYAISNDTLSTDYNQTKSVFDKYDVEQKVLIIDSYTHDIEWETLIKEHVSLLICIDDTPRIHNVDILIDNNYKAEMIEFYQKNMVATEKLLGSRYALIRSEFTNNKIQSLDDSFAVHVFFGGADYNNYTYYYSDKILDHNKEIYVYAIVSNSFTFEESLIKLKERYGKRFEYIISPRSMAEIMEKCSFALGSPGTTTWERMAVGLPCAYLATNSNQIPILQEIQNDKLGINLGEATKNIPLKQFQTFIEFLEDANLQNEISKNGKKLIDGQGSKRITDFIINKLEGR